MPRQDKVARRQRLSVDLPGEAESAFRRVAERYFRGAPSDALRAAVSLLTWMVEARAAGKRVVAVEAEEPLERYEEPVVPGLEELLNPKWKWLVERPHLWRRQLWIKGRRLTAGDLARTAAIEGWSPAQTAAEFDLPVEAAEEAMRYLAANRDLVLHEEAENRIAAESAVSDTTPAPSAV